MVTFVFGQAPLPLDALKIGRFVVNVAEPYADYLDPECKPPTIHISSQLQYHMKLEDATDKDYSLQLTHLVSSARSKRKKLRSEVTTDRVLSYRLDSSTAWFLNAVKLQETRRWIEQAVSQGDDIYMVVGYHTLTNAVIRELAVTEGSASVKAKLPVSAALAASSGLVLPVSIVDPTIGGESGHKDGAQTEFVVLGEQICAIQYRKVRFKWYSSKDLDRATLDKTNQWRTFMDVRGQGDAVEDDVVEVDVEDKDPEEAEIDGDWERVILDNGEVCLF